MSATGRGGERIASDNYPTPAWCVHRLLEVCPLPLASLGVRRWLEPCAGDGAIMRAVDTFLRPEDRPSWTAVEIRPEAAELIPARDGDLVHVGDFLRDAPPSGPFITIITNPPYSLAMEFIQRSFDLAPGAFIVMLLRVNFAASAARSTFMREFPPDVYVLPNRPSFTNGGTDATEYAWFVWPPIRRRTHGSFRVLATTSKEERGVRSG